VQAHLVGPIYEVPMGRARDLELKDVNKFGLEVLKLDLLGHILHDLLLQIVVVAWQFRDGADQPQRPTHHFEFGPIRS